MSITSQHQEELLSVAYAYAVAAQAGMNIKHDVLDYGIDMTFSPVSTLPSGQRTSTGYNLHIQLKSTISSSVVDDSIVYDLEADTYNKLRMWDGPARCYLVLFRLPADATLWLSVNEDVLTLRHCCYWHFIEPGDTIKNTSSKRIRIPRANQFTADALIALMDQIKKDRS